MTKMPPRLRCPPRLRPRHMTRTRHMTWNKMMTMIMMTTDKDTDKALRGKAKSKGYKGKGMVKRVGPEGLLEPM